MKAKNLFSTLVLICVSVIAANAQTLFNFTSGDFIHNLIFAPNATGTFRFFAPNTDVNGAFRGSESSGVYATCDFGHPRCVPGSTFTFFENITGISAFHSNVTPVVVNGVTYKQVFYNQSSLRVEAAPVRIPWRMSKRKTFKLTLRVHAVGSLKGNSPGPSTPVFSGGIDLWGWATVEFIRDESGRFPFPEQNYLLTGNVVYNFPAP